MAFRTQKISQMTPKGADLEATDLLEVSTLESGSYVTRSITGQEIIDAAAGSGVTSVTGSAPIASSGGSTPAISIANANTTTTGAISSTDWNTFNGKQAALVSGTNIKTVNSTSLLGSGNLAVQPTLVSGTNIKTVNSTSLLGSGDVAVQSPITLTTTGTSGAATLVGATLNIPQYGGGGTSNPSVVALSATDGTAVTGTVADTISRTLLIPANTFTTDGMLEVVGRVLKTGTVGNQSFRIYKNTSNSLTGATLIGAFLSSNTATLAQGIRTFRITSNTLTGFPTSAAVQTDYSTNLNAEVSTTFTTSVDNYIIFSIQLGSSADSSVVRMARATKYI